MTFKLKIGEIYWNEMAWRHVFVETPKNGAALLDIEQHYIMEQPFLLLDYRPYEYQEAIRHNKKLPPAWWLKILVDEKIRWMVYMPNQDDYISLLKDKL